MSVSKFWINLTIDLSHSDKNQGEQPQSRWWTLQLARDLQSPSEIPAAHDELSSSNKAALASTSDVRVTKSGVSARKLL